ncbi:hypothetical protein D3C83_94790 [compost metagenome]
MFVRHPNQLRDQRRLRVVRVIHSHLIAAVLAPERDNQVLAESRLQGTERREVSPGRQLDDLGKTAEVIRC